MNDVHFYVNFYANRNWLIYILTNKMLFNSRD